MNTLFGLFKRKKDEEVFIDLPDVIPIDNTPHEAAIARIFAAAVEKAGELQRGESFEISLDPAEIDPHIHPVEIFGPVAVRANEYGLTSTGCYNWVFAFRKL